MKKFNKSQLIHSLESRKLDKHRSSYFLGDFGCADVFGGTFLSNSPQGLLKNLASLGADVSEWQWDEDGWVKGCAEQEVVEPVSEIEHLVEQPEEVKVEEVIPQQEVSLPEVDWEWVESLTNTSPSKKDLEEYARKFDVELKRNKTISNMIVDFKEALNV